MIVYIDDMYTTQESQEVVYIVCAKLNIKCYVLSMREGCIAIEMSDEDATMFTMMNGKELVWKKYLGDSYIDRRIDDY